MGRTFTTLALTAVALVAAAAVALPASAAREPARPVAARDIVGTAVAAGSFTTLTRLLREAGLVRTLRGAGPFAVFAPTDAAFRKIPRDTLRRLASDRAALRAVLLHHVARGRLTAASVARRRFVRTLDGERVRVRVRGSAVLVGGARVVRADVTASNGVIHAIDRVLLPR
ncbi:fasciclin domain-containing protein [Conexibacter arvalis]|uniref:Putative surface protein with fasciclin (FAS1) repeats n=1 Tax=Conexibacter arvalis TaxID=912552 RepID=A0A840IE80_9ACTN|nr:fasciclin domain-containing protein [Conexibacter arvalis]MBB4663102.1 putative surface protein with fasciclin (FAS1) repeats [Conexibacter arvalis]